MFTQYFKEVEREVKMRNGSQMPLKNTNTLLRNLQNGSYFEEKRKNKKKKKAKKKQLQKLMTGTTECPVYHCQNEDWRENRQQEPTQKELLRGFKGFGPSRKLVFDKNL